MDQIIEGATIKYPPQMLAEEEETVLRSIEQNLQQQRMDLETYLKMIEMDRPAFIAKEVTPMAKSRLERSLVLDQVARDENIRLEQKELETAFNETFSELQNSADIEKMRRQVSDERLSEFLTYEAASRALNRRVMQRLKQIATGEEIIDTPEAEEIVEDAGAEPVEDAGAELVEETANTPEDTEEKDAEAPEA